MDSLSSLAPLYAQIAAELRRDIDLGRFPEGSRIPSEHELAERFRVGRPTVRQATQLLVTDGVLARRRGSGTYVNRPDAQLDVLSFGGTLASLQRSAAETSSKIVGKVSLRPAPRRDVDFPTADAFRVVRVSSVGGSPVLLEELFFSTAVFPKLDTHPVTDRSLSTLARVHYGLSAESLEQRFSVVQLDGKRAQLLALPAATHVLQVDRVVHFSAAPHAVFAVLYCKTEEAEFTQNLHK